MEMKNITETVIGSLNWILILKERIRIYVNIYMYCIVLTRIKYVYAWMDLYKIWITRII